MLVGPALLQDLLFLELRIEPLQIEAHEPWGPGCHGLLEEAGMDSPKMSRRQAAGLGHYPLEGYWVVQGALDGFTPLP